MPINRAPFNALVDDDGSNTIGTPWNKAAIAGVVLDPVDAALAAVGGLVLLGSASGQTVNSVAESPAYVAVPQMALGDRLRVSVVGVHSGGTAPVVLLLATYDTVNGGIRPAVTLTGATGAGDLVPNGVGMFDVWAAPLPASGASIEWLGQGAITSGLVQARGFPYGVLGQGNFVGSPTNYVYFQHGGLTAGGTLIWSWTVHLLKGGVAGAAAKPAPLPAPGGPGVPEPRAEGVGGSPANVLTEGPLATGEPGS